MSIKRITIIITIILFFALFGIFYLFRSASESKLDLVKVNDIVQSVSEQWGKLGTARLPCLEYKLDYVVINEKGTVIAATRKGLDEDLSSAVANRDTVVDISNGESQVGKVIIYNDITKRWQNYRNNLFIITSVIIVLIVLFILIYGLYIDRLIFRPFRKMQAFAKNVAEGDLEIPLIMDKSNMFGAFTESFDMLRDELALARKNEEKEKQSKKELVASLSHDIKTPVSSIKAVSELMAVKTNDEAQRKQLEIINAKADQINALITNMFNATLEEIQELRVNVTAQPSDILYDIISQADYNNRSFIPHIPECKILADKLRLTQVIDNIITNSYKYADTSIDVSVRIEGDHLRVDFADHGDGVSDEEVWGLLHKFFRASNSKGKSGTGLGLYISKYLMNKMGGEIRCENVPGGFCVSIYLRIG